jgi:hypothetical protein
MRAILTRGAVTKVSAEPGDNTGELDVDVTFNFRSCSPVWVAELISKLSADASYVDVEITEHV